jgi:hypothetical protein
MFVTDPSGETLCSETESDDTFRGGRILVAREVYSFPQMNAHLARYPALAAAVGLTEIKDCEAARQYVRGYQEFSKAHPDFDRKGPTKAEQFREFLRDSENATESRGRASPQP